MLVNQREVKIMWIRFIPVLFFSLTAISLFAYQGVEIIHAIQDFIFDKNRLK